MKNDRFKLWDKLGKYWISDPKSILEWCRYFSENKELHCWLEIEENTEWVQFTGKLDRNSQEIYEGDIDKEGYVVEWHNRTSEYLLRSKTGWTKISPTTKNIGNRFQNLELIPKEA